MKRGFYLLFIILGLLTVAVNAQNNSNLKKYMQVDSLVHFYISTQQFEKAVETLESAKLQSTEYLLRTLNEIAEQCVMNNQINKAIDTYEYGHTKGIFFSLSPISPIFMKLGKEERFINFINEDRRMLSEARSKVKAYYDIVYPPAFDSTKKYPALILMHGLGGSAAEMKRNCRIDKLQSRIIIVFLQSSQLIRINRLGWEDVQKSRTDIIEMYNILKENKNIDESKIIIGGMSQGGEISIDAVVNNVIPMIGFIALNPAGGFMEGFEITNIKKAVEREVTGQVITGENDEYFNKQKKVAEYLKECGMRIQFVVIPNVGHQYPPDVVERLDGAINYILDK